MKSAEQPYTGISELDVMRHAHNYNQFLINIISSKIDSSFQVVDFGAGNGFFASKIQPSLNKQLICIEPDSELRSKISKSHQLSALPDLSTVSDSSIDFVYTLNVLEHIEDDVESLSLIYRKLKPGSHLYIYVPAFPILFSSNDLKVGHVRRYKMLELNRKLELAGFKILSSHYEDFLGFWATLLFKFIDRKKTGDINLTTLIIYDRFIFPFNILFKPFFKKILGKNLSVFVSKPCI